MSLFLKSARLRIRGILAGGTRTPRDLMHAAEIASEADVSLREARESVKRVKEAKRRLLKRRNFR